MECRDAKGVGSDARCQVVWELKVTKATFYSAQNRRGLRIQGNPTKSKVKMDLSPELLSRRMDLLESDR